jgi:hypothetical protein
MELIQPANEDVDDDSYTTTNPTADLLPISRKEGRKHILPLQKLIFTRSQTIPNLIDNYPQMFRFCDRTSDIIPYSDASNDTNTLTLTCPVAFGHSGSSACQTRYRCGLEDNTPGEMRSSNDYHFSKPMG